MANVLLVVSVNLTQSEKQTELWRMVAMKIRPEVAEMHHIFRRKKATSVAIGAGICSHAVLRSEKRFFVAALVSSVTILSGCSTSSQLDHAPPIYVHEAVLPSKTELDIPTFEVIARTDRQVEIADKKIQLLPPTGSNGGFRCGTDWMTTDRRIQEFFRRPHLTLSFQGDYTVWTPIQGPPQTYLRLRLEHTSANLTNEN